MASRGAANSVIPLAGGRTGARIMDAVALLIVAASIYLSGRIAERRGRSFKSWAWIAAFIGPFALPLLFLFPNLCATNSDHA
jgi:hypothetical protein